MSHRERQAPVPARAAENTSDLVPRYRVPTLAGEMLVPDPRATGDKRAGELVPEPRALSPSCGWTQHSPGSSGFLIPLTPPQSGSPCNFKSSQISQILAHSASVKAGK